MRNLVLFATLSVALASHAGAQSGVRSGVRPSQPARVPSPQPPPGVSTIQPGKPDARLGAGGVRPTTGNILYPGTPNDRSPGNVISPGIPTISQPVPSVVQPVPDPQASPVRDHGRGHHRGRRFGGAYPVYGVYPYIPNVIAVPGSTVVNSSSGYVITVGEEKPDEAAQQEAPSDEAEPEYWLIALRGGLIYAVSGYALEERALRFVTLQGDEYVVPLAELDRDFTVKLNRDRGVQIELD